MDAMNFQRKTLLHSHKDLDTTKMIENQVLCKGLTHRESTHENLQSYSVRTKMIVENTSCVGTLKKSGLQTTIKIFLRSFVAVRASLGVNILGCHVRCHSCWVFLCCMSIGLSCHIGC